MNQPAMNENSPSQAGAVAKPGTLANPSTLLVLLSNLIPLAGVLYWHWDAFLLLMLYWCETLIIAFWTLMRLLTLPRTGGIVSHISSNLFFTGFFTVHAGIFMTVHFFFLWSLFGGGWVSEVRDARDFIDKILIAAGLWLPLSLSFIGRGIGFAIEKASNETLARWERLFYPGALLPEPRLPQKPGEWGGVIASLYGRIVLMHIVVLAGAGLSQLLGTMAPFLLLILLKTFIDLLFHVRIDLSRVQVEVKLG